MQDKGRSAFKQNTAQFSQQRHRSAAKKQYAHTQHVLEHDVAQDREGRGDARHGQHGLPDTVLVHGVEMQDLLARGDAALMEWGVGCGGVVSFDVG